MNRERRINGRRKGRGRGRGEGCEKGMRGRIRRVVGRQRRERREG